MCINAVAAAAAGIDISKIAMHTAKHILVNRVFCRRVEWKL